MNKDQVQGTVKEVVGKLQEKTGEALGNVDQQAKGLIKEAEGHVQKNIGDLKEAVKDALQNVPAKP